MLTSTQTSDTPGRRPVIVAITQTIGIYRTANSYAMKLAWITNSTPDPPAGTIDRSPDGTLTGVLKEAAQSLVTRLIPPLASDQVPNRLVKNIRNSIKRNAPQSKIRESAVRSGTLAAAVKLSLSASSAAADIFHRVRR